MNVYVTKEGIYKIYNTIITQKNNTEEQTMRDTSLKQIRHCKKGP